MVSTSYKSACVRMHSLVAATLQPNCVRVLHATAASDSTASPRTVQPQSTAAALQRALLHAALVHDAA
jgi:hypothetical protein